MTVLKQRSNPQRHIHQVLQTYTVQAVLPPYGLVVVANTHGMPGGQNIQLAPLVSNTGLYGVHVTAQAGLHTIKNGTQAGTGAVILGTTKQCRSAILAAEQQVLGMYDTSACITAASSLYIKKLRGTLYSGIQDNSISLQVHGSQLQTSWQGDYSIREVQACGGIFVGSSLILLQGGKFCSIGLSQSNCKLWAQALSIQTATPNSLHLVESGQNYMLYTANACEALGYIGSVDMVLQEQQSAQGLRYSRLQQAQNSKPASGLYRVHNITSTRLNMSIQTLLQPVQTTQGAVTGDTKLRVLRSSWLQHDTGTQRIFSTACRASVVGQGIPGALYWEAGVQPQQLSQNDLQRLQRVRKRQQQLPAFFAQLLQQQLQLPIQYVKAHKQLTNTRVLQYKDQVDVSSIIAQTADGSIILKDGSGSQIRMTNGNIYISAANDIYIEPRRHIMMMPGQALACAAGKVQVSGTTAVSFISGANIDLIAGARPAQSQNMAGGSDAQSTVVYGTVNIHGTSVNVRAVQNIDIRSSSLYIAGYNDTNGCSLTVNAGKADTTIYANAIHARAQTTLSCLAKSSGIYTDSSQTIVCGDVCTCTGVLRLSRSPVSGLASARQHAIFAQSATFAQCSIYGNLAVKQGIICNVLGYYVSQGKQPKPQNRSEQNYVLKGRFGSLNIMRFTVNQRWIPTTPPEVQNAPWVWVSILSPEAGWGYQSYMYSWQKDYTEAQYHGLCVEVSDTTQYTFPGKKQSTKFFILNTQQLKVQQETLQKFVIK